MKRGSVDWEVVKSVVSRISEIAPDFLEDNVLIGGSAAWFYRSHLERVNDPDFPPIAYSSDECQLWYSKDIDVLGTKRDDIGRQLGVPLSGDPCVPRVDGVWIDSPDEGVFITKSNTASSALHTNLTDGTEFKIASPILLYREKFDLRDSPKDRPQDNLHLRTLESASRLAICQLAESDPLTKSTCRELYALLKEAQEIAPDLLANEALFARLQNQMQRFSEQKVANTLWHLLNKQILPLIENRLAAQSQEAAAQEAADTPQSVKPKF